MYGQYWNSRWQLAFLSRSSPKVAPRETTAIVTENCLGGASNGMLVASLAAHGRPLGSEFVVAVLFAIYLLVVVAIPLTLGIVVSFRSLTRERRCPLCGGETAQIASVVVRATRTAWRGSTLQRRWCAACSWEGYARVRSAPLKPAVELSPVMVRVPTRGCKTEPLRMLRFGGSQWRVLLQCWQEQEVHHGRLVFVGPAGRMWRDGIELFSGPTRGDVVRQALSLSDGLLTYRLRDLVSD
jgi:hypothetical protein